jgi:large subunit ribosomal protein L15
MPLYRKLPHRGFNRARFKDVYPVVNVGDFERLDASVTEVNAVMLASAGIIGHGETHVKILGDGELTRAFKVTAVRFSESAKAKIEKAGGQVIIAE